mgnify:CR=1 FL=1
MPAKTVCFESLRKFDGFSFRILNSKEFFQIAGRAGRRGIDKEGFVYVMVNRRDLDYPKMKSITTEDREPIRSQFKLSVNTVLNLIQQHNEIEIDKILSMSFHSYQKYGPLYMKKKNVRSHNAFFKTKKKLEALGYVKNNTLTEKGIFSAKIYADEILLGEIFATDTYKKFNEYQILLLLGCICFEARERTTFSQRFRTTFLSDLKRAIRSDHYLNKEKRFEQLDNITALIHPCYHGSTIFDILKNTNLLEGDLIRIFRQILDRIGQIRNATTDERLSAMLHNSQTLIIDCLKDIDVL